VRCDATREHFNVPVDRGKAVLKISVAPSKWILNTRVNRPIPDAHQREASEVRYTLPEHFSQLPRLEHHDEISPLKQRRPQSN
jgi:hypothetical protein